MKYYTLHFNYAVSIHPDSDIEDVAQMLQERLAALGYVMELEDFSIEEATDGSDDRYHSGSGESMDDESYEQYLNGPSNPF